MIKTGHRRREKRPRKIGSRARGPNPGAHHNEVDRDQAEDGDHAKDQDEAEQGDKGSAEDADNENDRVDEALPDKQPATPSVVNAESGSTPLA